MNFLTKNLMYFTASFAAACALFRFGLSYSLVQQMYTAAILMSVGYAVLNFSLGWYFGKRDSVMLPIYDIGFRFHFASFLMFHAVSLTWFWLGFNAPTESIQTVYWTAFYWGIGLAIHLVIYLLTRKNAILGLEKDEIFD